MAVRGSIKNKAHADIPRVLVLRNWHEYLGESLLIVFSVLLALGLTEFFTGLHEKHQTSEIMRAVRNEILRNKEHELVQISYHREVLNNIDWLLASDSARKGFIRDGVLDLHKIAPDGIMKKDLDDVAWQIALHHDVISKIDIGLASILSDIYDNQERIKKLEEKAADVVLARESRTATDNRITLLLLRDNFHGWAVDRAPGMIIKYDDAIRTLDSLKY